MHEFQRLNSEEDNSVNWVIPSSDGLFFETRLVEREDGHYIIYVSSQSGCVQKCKFCHLTQTGQFVNITNACSLNLKHQLKTVVAEGLSKYQEQGKIKRLSIAYMARGEPLDRQNFLYDFLETKEEIIPELLNKAGLGDLPLKYKVSTIFPISRAKNFENILQVLGSEDDNNVFLYWSLYSLQNSFRKKWLPNASDPYLLRGMLKDFYEKTNGRLVIHSAWIAGENDTETQVIDLAEFLQENFPRIRFNHVTYNPYYKQSGEVGCESPQDIIKRNHDILIDHGINVKSIKRVGYDVKASCGMFVDKVKV